MISGNGLLCHTTPPISCMVINPKNPKINFKFSINFSGPGTDIKDAITIARSKLTAIVIANETYLTYFSKLQL